MKTMKWLALCAVIFAGVACGQPSEEVAPASLQSALEEPKYLVTEEEHKALVDQCEKESSSQCIDQKEKGEPESAYASRSCGACNNGIAVCCTLKRSGFIVWVECKSVACHCSRDQTAPLCMYDNVPIG